NEMLRRANGCSSSWVVYPNPEGDRGCARGTISGFEVTAQLCADRQSVTSPVDGPEGICRVMRGGASKQVFRDPRDPCSNPAAMPRPDQCDGSFSPRLPSLVRPSLRLFGGLLLFDALGLDGIGVGTMISNQRSP